MTHTPGPWSISTDWEATGVIYALRGFEWDDICVITPRCEAAANAHLIAAAPDMLEALEEVVALTENLEVCPFCCAVKGVQSHGPDCLSHEIEAAIRKARGEDA